MAYTLLSREREWLIAALGEPIVNYYIDRLERWGANHPKAQFNAVTVMLKWHYEDKKSGRLKALGLSNTSEEKKRTYDADTLNRMFDNLKYEDL